MKDGSGANAAMGVMTAFGLGQLAKLKDGSVSLSDAAYSITGNAADAAAYAALVADTKNLPKPMTMADMGLIAPVAAPAPAAMWFHPCAQAALECAAQSSARGTFPTTRWSAVRIRSGRSAGGVQRGWQLSRTVGRSRNGQRRWQ